NRLALGVLALAVLGGVLAEPAIAQREGVPVKNALVVVTSQEDVELQNLLDAGGPPSSIKKMLKTAEALLSVSTYYSSTEATGHFSIEVPPGPETYSVSVFAPGYLASSGSSTDLIDGGGTTQNATIFLQPSAVISGRVTDGDGRPIPGIVVAASSPHSTNYDVTMDDGVFVLDTDLKTGTHFIHAFKPAINNISRLQDEIADPNLPLESRVPLPFRTSDSGYVAFVSTVMLEQGKLTTLNIQLRDSLSIGGKVTDSLGMPVAGVAVVAFDNAGNMTNAIDVTDAGGNYALENDLSPGEYTVIVPSIFSKGYASASSEVNLPTEEPVNISLQNSSEIHGAVVDANGGPVEGASVFAIGLQSTDEHQLMDFLAGGMAETKTDENGRFNLNRGISNGSYVVTASFGDVPATTSMEATPGKELTIPLDFTELVTLRGRITDSTGNPIQNAQIAPSFAAVISSDETIGAKSGSDGSFVLTAPIRDAAEKSLFSEIVASADGYATKTAQVEGAAANIVLEKEIAARISGTIIAQRSLAPPVEIALSRAGIINFYHEGSSYGVDLHTNSRVLDARFDPHAKRIDISLEGVQGSAGMSELSIPKHFLAGPFAISLDGKNVEPDDFKVSENKTHSVIAVPHDHNLQELVIQGSTAVPEFPLPAVVAAVALAAALVHRRLRLT
ncbi:MAG TPA: carboxypeptidase-like regulatory domain-containing protein, partial [Nitrososphaera sp.]|nr:carboxypeptidase-like regulatory domain-containing protein [Nitrososphaera sp.]